MYKTALAYHVKVSVVIICKYKAHLPTYRDNQVKITEKNKYFVMKTF